MVVMFLMFWDLLAGSRIESMRLSLGTNQTRDQTLHTVLARNLRGAIRQPPPGLAMPGDALRRRALDLHKLMLQVLAGQLTHGNATHLNVPRRDLGDRAQPRQPEDILGQEVLLGVVAFVMNEQTLDERGELLTNLPAHLGDRR
jgi:hypothetical protein